MRAYIKAHGHRAGVIVAAMMCFAASRTIASGDLPANGDQEAFARGLGAAWLQNRSAFKQFSCRYHISLGQAATRDEALNGQVAEHFAAECVWAVQDDWERCSIVVINDKAPRVMTASKDGSAYVSAPMATTHFMTDGPLQIYHSPEMRGATLWGAELSQGNDLTTPFSMGVMGPGETANPSIIIERSIRGHGRVEVTDGAGIAGGEGLRVRISSADGTYGIYSFDPNRGFLTSAIIMGRAERILTEVNVLAAKESSEGFWFPMRSVRIDFPAENGRPLWVREIEVSELTFAPDPADFALVLPAGTTLVDRSDGRSQHRLHEPLGVTAETLPEVEARCRQVALNRGGGLPATHGLPEPRRTNWWLVVGISAMVAVATWGLLRRFRSR